MVVEIVEKTENGIKVHGLRHMDGRKKETKKELKRIKDLKMAIHEGNNCNKYIEVKGKWLNDRLQKEAEIYLGEKFNDHEIYTVYNDRSVSNSQGHEVAYDFITDEVSNEIGF